MANNIKHLREAAGITHAELAAAKGAYARMWADYNQAAQWKITRKEEAK